MGCHHECELVWGTWACGCCPHDSGCYPALFPYKCPACGAFDVSFPSPSVATSQCGACKRHVVALMSATCFCDDHYGAEVEWCCRGPVYWPGLHSTTHGSRLWGVARRWELARASELARVT